MLPLVRSFIVVATALTVSTELKAQTSSNVNQDQSTAVLTQKVKGRVVDAESKQPLPGVVALLVSNTNINTITDAEGYFILENVPVGRQSFRFSIMGFEPYTASEVMIISGKELDLNISLNESLHKLQEVTIKANGNRTRPLNEFATISARSFSVEETRRYAASVADPARMVMNFPGVSNSGDDNSIVVRGNSPKGVLWRLEGIEIPNPNHFSAQGSSGGSISMLNANTLGNSDFYTGAFAPEIGNALSGAFDLNLRNGNTERYEHTVQLGTLGVEVATEGPFQLGKKASYLLNYRYSTFALLESFLDLGGILPNYQDASFKMNFPTENAGTFSVFGLGGYNVASKDVEADSSKWDDDNTNVNFDNKNHMGVAGISHQFFISKDAYLKTVISASTDKAQQDADTLNPSEAYANVPVEHTAITNTAMRLSVLYNQKLNARNTFRTGIIAQQLGYDLNYSFYNSTEKQWKTILSGNGGTQFYQGYFQWKSRITEQLTFVGGVHGSYLALNEKYSVEPRAAFTYQLNKNKFSLAAGLHSKPEHISTYLFQNAAQGQAITHPNKDLDLQRALHTVAGYETVLPWNVRFKTEVYYQKLYNIPVEADTSTSFSMLNAEDVFALLGTTKPLVSEGEGENYGIDISFERPFANNYYFLVSGSVFNSTYTDFSGNEYNTRYNRGYMMNLTAGKEFKLNTSGRKIIGLNGRVTYSGGLRESLIDINQSIQSQKTVLVRGEYFTQQAPYYFRTDMSVYYKINKKRSTHTLQLDVMNCTNQQNYYFSYFDNKKGEIKRVNYLGIIPNLSYRIDFHW